MPIECANCGYAQVEKFCPDCGQKKFSGRITVKNTLAEAFAGLFNIERGLWFTIRSLTVTPGETIHQYVSGSIKRFFNPFKYLLLAATVGALTNYFITPEFDFSQFGIEGGIEDARKSEFKKILLEVIFDQYVLITMLFIPVYALFMSVLFRKKGRNFAEMIVFNAFCQGHYTFVFSIVGSLAVLAGMNVMDMSGLGMLLMFSFTIWAAKDFFRVSWISAIVRAGLSTFLGFFIGILLIVAGIAVVVAMRRPELLNA